LAPIALVAVALSVYLIVHDNLAHSRPSAAATSTGAGTLTEAGRRPARRSHSRPRFYVVRSGDTLSGIAAKTGVGISTLIALNPSLARSQNNLQVGQRLRLRR